MNNTLISNIGYSENDPNKRLFEIDDSKILTSNPPKYQIKYLDNGEIGYLPCHNVIRVNKNDELINF